MLNVTRLSPLLLVLAALPAVAQTGPNPNSVHILNFTYAGTGCPAGTATSALSPDQTTLTVLFDAFVAEAGPGIPLSESRRNCQMNVTLHVPQGWSYAVSTVDYRGYVRLDNKVQGTQKSTYYFSGNLAQASAETKFVGTKDEDYVIRHMIPFQNLVWSACGEQRAANINTQVRVNNSTNTSGRGVLTVDSVDGNVAQIYHLQWKPCPITP